MYAGYAKTAPGALTVRTFSPAHAERVASLIVSIQREEFGIPITLDAQPDLRDIAGFYQHGAGNFWVALHGDRVVGSIALLDIGDAKGALRKMFVAPEFRGREHGAAGLLLAELLDWSRSRRLSGIFLGTTAKFLAAHRFYEKNGFHEIGRDELPAAFPVMTVDTKFYRRSVEPIAEKTRQESP